MDLTTTFIHKNYMELSSRSPFTRKFMYFDIPEYKADDIFNEVGVLPKFEEEMVRDGTPYVIIFCRVKKTEIHKFQLAMDKLINKMLLLGFEDYLDYCGDVFKLFESEETDDDADEIEHLRARAENLNLYLQYVAKRDPKLMEELDEWFDGMPGYTEVSE